MTEEKLFNPDLRWHPGTGEMTAAQLAAIHTRHASAIRPIPSATALGYDHLMADADRGALLAELNRETEGAERLREELSRERGANARLRVALATAQRERKGLEEDYNTRTAERDRLRDRLNPYAW